ncbi:MAG TPA: sigma-54 dependent transcriptional regulator [Phycisphaerae bacterium]|nr:sigma-54 dependent transcriptional regulator [Phycisphaerae bacterium]
MARICVVDDKELIRDSLCETLSREDHQPIAFADPVEALDAIREEGFDLVLTDMKMPRLDGISLIREMRAANCDTPAIVMTAFGTVSSAVEAMKLGVFDYIQKPFEADAIIIQVDRALQHSQLSRENEALRKSVEDLCKVRPIVGDGPAMTDLRRRVALVADSDATVLIGGESGSGKELVALAVHARSRRADRPMLCLNCAALSGSLLESELFGHERGAFTGADRLRKGRFELANGGTLLLDEVSEMALPLQAKLLRVLQEGEFERVGSSMTRRADVRIIATTNRNLADWVARKRFRADLFYRLNVLPVQVPPLRERPEDLTDLVAHFFDLVARREDRGPLRIEPGAWSLLQQYSWPGNVRELENLCQRAAALVPDGVVTQAVIESWISPAPQQPAEFTNLREGRLLEDAERQLIEKTLARHAGHRARTAKALGIGVRTLGMKLKQWREEAEAARRTTVLAGVR